MKKLSNIETFKSNFFLYEDSKEAFQIFEPYTFIKTKKGEALAFFGCQNNANWWPLAMHFFLYDDFK